MKFYILIGFIVVFVTNGLHSISIKHYPSVTENNCGISRQSLLMNGVNHCFKWSSNNNVTTSVQNGRLAQPGEWPWIAFIDIYKTFWGFKYDNKMCTGVILNNNWISTAAHCIFIDNTISVRLVRDYSQHTSHVYGVDMYVIHPNYTVFMNTRPGLEQAYDIALLKLSSNISMTTTTITELTVGRYPTVNAICLPDRDIVNTDKELALFAGFGNIDENYVTNLGPLRTGWLRMNEPTNTALDRWTYFIRSNRYLINDGLGICPGDSGGPLIQYEFDSQRAILIGLGIRYWPANISTGCPARVADAGNIFVRISKHIDWIINTVAAH
ncbi:chymotrypsin-like elastase family member 2A [Oppia nitens]|uniref:chymotrypsin-like elastase family member 2A n=2 Tax=Oppia nitens TaxID=1686743 RepID=UPI0023DCBBBF|nr:chymotrypsin-like elastase family member 2A [Oppia nitens]